VEDETPLLKLAERALRRAGFEVVAAASAEEALSCWMPGGCARLPSSPTW
jgi:DNA-binding response OmpR family regulator